MKMDIFEIMSNLQKKQFAHDRRAHRDLLSFDIYSKIKHMTLHFAKYAGKIQGALISNDMEELKKSLLDTFIICMATANALNKILGSRLHIAQPEKFANIDAFTKSLSGPANSSDFLIDLVVNTGKLAKAIESTDHMEMGNPRKDIEEALETIFTVTVQAMRGLNLEIEAALDRRFTLIEAKQVIQI